jgi:hypothetical protein
MKKISSCPGWLEVSTDRLSFVYVPERAEVLRNIFQLSISGLGSYTIAKQLTRRGVPPFGTSKQWDNTTIDSMLRNRAVIGEFQPRSFAGGSKKGVPIGDPIPNYYPPIIDEKTFLTAQEARRHNLASGRGRKGDHLASLFSGVTTCFYCGDPVKFHRNGQSRSLICTRALLLNDCVRAAWSYDDFERSVLNFICHPALPLAIDSTRRDALASLVDDIKTIAVSGDFDNRMQVSLSLKEAVTVLKVASGGTSTRTHPDSLIARDPPERRFEIALWGGQSFICPPSF